MLFVRRCPGCGEPARLICHNCEAKLRFLAVDQGASHELSRHRARVLGLDGFQAVFSYDPLVSRIILAAKNGGRRDVLVQLAGWLLVGPQTPSVAGSGFELDVVTWVPASRQQLRRRGYDQGYVLARAVGHRIGVRPCRLLGRSSREAQAGRSRADRLGGPHLRVRRPCPARVLLIDDVATTGASLARASEVLRSGGAQSVHAGVIAVVE